MKEIEVTYTNWDIDDVIIELARYIEKGFHIGSVYPEYLLGKCESKLTITLMEPYKS